MNQDNNAQSNPEETVVVEEAAEAVEAAGVNPDRDSKTAPVLEKQDIETTEKVSYGVLLKPNYFKKQCSSSSFLLT